jgi:hypothetical protein
MNTPLAPDAELIALCERVVAINAEERAIAAKYPDIDKDADDDPTDGPILDALSAEWHEIKRRILDLTITTLAGADAAGRAAFPESRQEQEAPGIEAVPTDLYELLALKLVEFHAGRPIGPAVQSADDRHPLLAIEEPLRALTTAVSLLGHLSVSELDVEGNDLEAVQTIIERAHRDIERRWEAAHEQRQAELEARAAVLVAHAAELAAAKAERGAPGSVDDVKKADASWWLLRGAAETALEYCRKADAARETTDGAE